MKSLTRSFILSLLVCFGLSLNLNILRADETINQCADYLSDSSASESISDKGAAVDLRLSTIAESIGLNLGIIPRSKLKNVYFKILELQDMDVLKLVLKRTPDLLLEKNEMGESGLMYLAKSGWVEGFQYLLNLEKIDLDYHHRYKNALILAAEYGHAQIVTQILNSDKFKSELKIYSRLDTALVEAAKNGHLSVLKILLDFLAKNSNPINFQSHLEQSLVYATEKEHPDLVKYLLTDFDINVNARSGHKYQPVLSYAINSKNREILDLLLSYKNIKLDLRLDDVSDYIRLAIKNDDLETFIKIKDSINFDINKQFNEGFSLLHLSAFANAERITKFIINDPEFKLINKSVNYLNKADRGNHSWMQQTPIGTAAMLGYDKVLLEILKHPDVDLNVPSKQGESVFLNALENGHLNVVEILLRTGKLKFDLEAHHFNQELTTDFSRVIDTKNEFLIDLIINHRLNALILLLLNPAAHPAVSKSPLAKIISMDNIPKSKRLLWIKTITEKIIQDPKITNFRLTDSFQHAIKQNFHEVLEILLERFPHVKIEIEFLLDAVRKNSIESLNILLRDETIEINKYINHDKGSTLLAVAIALNQFDVGMILLQDPRIDLNVGYSNANPVPDAYAWMKGVFKSENPNLDLVKSIIGSSDIDIHLGSKFNDNSLLIWSIEKNQVEFFDFILNSRSHNINFFAENNKNSALIAAVKSNNHYFLSELLNHPDIDLNLEDNAGKTALAYATESQSVEIFKMLLDHPQLNINKTDSYLHFSVIMNTLIQQKKYNFIKILIESPYHVTNAVNFFADNPTGREVLSKLQLTNEQLLTLDPLSALVNHFEDFELIQDIGLIQSTLLELGFPEEKTKMIYDRIRRRDVGLWFLEYIAADEYSKNATDSVDVLKNITNANFDSRQLRSMSENTLATLTEFLIEIHKYVKRDNRLWRRIDPDLYDKKNIKDLISFFGIFNSYYKTVHNGHAAYVDVFVGLLNDVELRTDNIVELTELTKQAMIKSVNRLLNTSNFEFNIESYQKLLSEWGDLEPIWVLISRLSEKNPGEVEVIRTIFKHSLEGTFKDYKFNTKDKQLQMLSPEQLEHWKEPEAIVNVGGQVSTLAEQISQSQEMVNQIVESNLHPHWSEFYESLNLKDSVEDISSSKFNNLLMELTVSQDNPKEIIQNLSKSKARLALSIINRLIGSFEVYSDDIETTKKVMTAIKLYLFNLDDMVKNSDLKYSPQEYLAIKDLVSQVIIDVNDIVKKITSVFTEADDRSIIATVKNSDPKLLLTIGDVVCTSSCQNYRTGSVIRTLPGYVIDGNVQAVVTFDLKSTDFQRGDFFKLLSWVEGKDDPYLVEFDGNLRQFTFTKNNTSIVT